MKENKKNVASDAQSIISLVVMLCIIVASVYLFCDYIDEYTAVDVDTVKTTTEVTTKEIVTTESVSNTEVVTSTEKIEVPKTTVVQTRATHTVVVDR